MWKILGFGRQFLGFLRHFLRMRSFLERGRRKYWIRSTRMILYLMGVGF